MHVMQYEVTLPADYDMGLIHGRVRERRWLLDDDEGLAFKAYTIRTRGSGGSPVNEYAPVYVWRDEAALARFIGGELFAGLCASFGRPGVRNWVGLEHVAGPASSERPRWGTRRVEGLDGDGDGNVAGVLDAAHARPACRPPLRGPARLRAGPQRHHGLRGRRSTAAPQALRHPNGR